MRLHSIEQPTAPRPPQSYDLLRDKERLDEDIEFDSRRDIPYRDRVSVVNAIVEIHSKRDGLWGQISRMARAYVLIFPESAGDVALENSVSGIQENIRESKVQCEKDSFLWRSFGLRASEFLTMFPQRRDEFNFDDAVWNGVKGYFDRFKKNQKWRGVAEMAVALILLFPERKKELQLDEEAWNGMKQDLSKLFSARFAAEMMLLFPERKNEIHIDDKVWKQEKHELKAYSRSKDWLQFMDLALHLTILAAQDARITKDGIEITPKKPKLASEPTPLPQMPR